ncbi:MAG: glutamine--fructose-6-phosphate transaminase (isomerizing) [Proteobacteria bacterium]|nr:glutamine--fructose-6-phosphate transaminase (isomerizing) [Pseudomonadota bacterium]
MCGILGITSASPVAGRLLKGLKLLEYRGYDSAGIAVLEKEHTHRLRASGKIANLESLMSRDACLDTGVIGIAHTRWATHGAPTDINAHPHTSEDVTLVHNGVIENHGQLRQELEMAGFTFESDTDTEVAVHLIEHYYKENVSLLEAVHKASKRLVGAFSLAVMSAREPGTLVGVRRASPFALGRGEGEMFLGSDAISLAAFTQQITFLEDGDLVVLTPSGATIYDASLTPVVREEIQSNLTPDLMSKAGYPHYMLKEMSEQSDVLRHILQRYTEDTTLLECDVDWAKIPRLTLVACGTSYFAGMVAKHWLERYADLSVELDIASEFRYRQPPMAEGGAALFISQSGETADTLAALEYAKHKGQYTMALLNVESSSMARAAHKVLPLYAGPEIGVASTKAFMAMLGTLALLTLKIAKARGALDAQAASTHLEDLKQVPAALEEILARRDSLREMARTLSASRDIIYIGRGTSYALAMEGALKLKEISYIHAEGYAAGELKHGPIALLDEHVPVITIAPHDELFDKTHANMQEALARGARIVLFSDQEGITKAKLGARAPESHHMTTFTLPNTTFLTAPLVYALPLQILSYETGLEKGADVDQPRNLAKSVTVE